MRLGSRINWPRCQMHVKTSLCVAMHLFLPLFGMLGHGTFPLAQALLFHCASAVFCSIEHLCGGRSNGELHVCSPWCCADALSHRCANDGVIVTKHKNCRRAQSLWSVCQVLASISSFQARENSTKILQTLCCFSPQHLQKLSPSASLRWRNTITCVKRRLAFMCSTSLTRCSSHAVPTTSSM